MEFIEKGEISLKNEEELHVMMDTIIMGSIAGYDL